MRFNFELFEKLVGFLKIGFVILNRIGCDKFMETDGILMSEKAGVVVLGFSLK